MKRRAFIKATSAGSMLGISAPKTFGNSLIPKPGMENGNVLKVHLLFKTHLDIGFTGSADKVLRKYFDRYIPAAMELARKSRMAGADGRFVWTTGSWLVYEFLERADTQRRREMEAAIDAGDVTWHGLPFTVQGELLSQSMLKADLNISRILDRRFGKNTVAAKVTDVPGQTRSLVPAMQEQGLDFLHIGVNPASALPEVPSMFRWRAPDGSEIMVAYQGDYGGILVLPDGKTAVSIVFTGDNKGPQNRDQVMNVYRALHKQFPEAKIMASDLNRVAADLGRLGDKLPVVTEEIGDSWIHGAASDPWKIARFRELMRFREQKLNEESFVALSDQDMAFSIPLSMVAEHTWGLDVKSHLKSWGVYNKEQLSAARNTEPFRNMEKSWQEKRAYIQTAIESLPQTLRQEAHRRLDALGPSGQDLSGMDKADLSEVFVFSHFRIRLDKNTGAIVSLTEKKTGINRADAGHPLALFVYQTFDQSDYDRFFGQYLRARKQWALDDFGKPGLKHTNAVGMTWLPVVRNACMARNENADLLFIELAVDGGAGTPPFGCPKVVAVKMEFPKSKPEIAITLNWFDKPATRLPEAVWFSFAPVLHSGEIWMMDKSGQKVDPRLVVRNGARKLHGVQSGVWLEGGHKFEIETMDAPIVAPGERNLLNFDNSLPVPEDGMHFCLYNNVWGTNYTMWFDDDMKFRFKLKFGGGRQSRSSDDQN
jgi:hypothetical protein